MRLLVALPVIVPAMFLWGWAEFLIEPTLGLADEPGASEASSVNASVDSIAKPQTIVEARSRAKLLFELVNGSLQVMHRDFFDDENAHTIPSASLDDVFVELKKSYGVELKWLNAGTDVVNTDHQPRGEFEIHAAKLIKRGERATEEMGQGEYRFAGAIRLDSQCLKCHLKDRQSNVARFAGLVIKMQLEK